MKLTRKEARELAAKLGQKLEERAKGRSSESARAWNGTLGEKGGQSTKGYAGDKVMDALCEAHGLPLPDSEVLFHPTRKWRLDHVWDGWLALEVQGGIFTRGRHVRGAALLDEYEKIAEAVIAGYTIIFCTPQQIDDGSIFAVIKRALDANV